jgi:diguanylate cyclase (GGDEF)-like protein
LAETWELGLDQPGSAGTTTLRLGGAFAALVVAMAVIVVIRGDIQLTEFPRFATFHSGFVLLADSIVAFLLFGQFMYRRLPCYLLLAAAYLFSALITVPFLLSFPGALRIEGGIIGGSQSAIWTWHIWHILFPGLIGVSMVVSERSRKFLVSRSLVTPCIAGTVASVLVLLALAIAATTVWHDWLPVLITRSPVPLTSSFYVVGGVAAVTTLAALGVTLHLVWKRSTALHVWVAVALVAVLADIAASLGAYNRFSVGWYFGRIESMTAAAVLLLVLLGRINQLYRGLAVTVGDLASANERLSSLVGEKEALVAVLQRREKEVRHLAYHDPVTGLPNRRLLMDRLDHQLAQAERYRHSLALLFLDLDNFKEINDAYGHEVGDMLLHEVAVRLGTCVRGGDTVSRLGGDEFVIVLPEISEESDAIVVAEKVIAALCRDFQIIGDVLRVSTSIGIALSTPEIRHDTSELMARADAAMYAAKQGGRNQYRLAA